PNQVSATLSMGAIACVYVALNPASSWRLKSIMALVGLWLLGQAAFTFSRTGIYLFCSALGVVAMLASRGSRAPLMVLIACLGVGMAIVWPKLDQITGGKLAERFSDKALGGREDLILSDLRIFADYPLLGCGVGVTKYLRSYYGPG